MTSATSFIHEDEVQWLDLLCSGLLRIVGWLIGCGCFGKTSVPSSRVKTFEDFLSLEYGTDMLSRNVHIKVTYAA